MKGKGRDDTHLFFYMTKTTKLFILMLRLSVGWLLFYAGITKVLDSEWTSAGYLKGAKTFSALYQWFGSAQNIGWVDFLNEWGLTLVGIALILGLATRAAALFGILLMLLYYFPILQFPYVGEHSYIVDEHIIYSFVLLIFIVSRAGRNWGLDAYIHRSSGKIPSLVS